MSARSMARARERELDRDRRRLSRRVRRASAGAAVALGAGIALAPAADAATFNVNSNNDGPANACDATCTLRDAIEAANADAAEDLITFAPTVTGSIELDPGEGELPIEAATVIRGPGAEALTVEAFSSSQLFDVDVSTVGASYDDVSISGLTLRGGLDPSGGAFDAENSDVTIDALVLRQNEADNIGGAISVDNGKLTVLNSRFANNTAGEGGAIYANDDFPSVGDGSASLVIRDSTFTGNTATEPGTGSAGAVYFDDTVDSALISGSTFSGNVASFGGGAINAFGVQTGVARIENSTITGNTAGHAGGGIYVYNEYDNPIEIVNSTVTGNVAGDTGGGLYNYAFDDPVESGNGDVTVSSTVVAGNDATVGPDLANRVYEAGDNPVQGTFLTGFSLIGDTAGAPITETPAGSNILNADPQLGGLTNNGGPTQTMLPAATSPLVDAGVANGLTTDQRGLPRTVKRSFTLPPGGDGTDIGSVELQDNGLTGTTVKAEKKQRQKGKKVVITVLAGADEDVQATGSGSIKAGKAKAKLKTVTKTVAGGKLAKLKLTPKKKKDSKKIIDALEKKEGKAKLKVVLTDPAGNSETEKPKVTLKG